MSFNDIREIKLSRKFPDLQYILHVEEAGLKYCKRQYCSCITYINYFRLLIDNMSLEILDLPSKQYLHVYVAGSTLFILPLHVPTLARNIS